MQILILGYIVRGPLGGLAWHHLQYVLGLKQLGHNVMFLEDSDDYASCYNPETFEVSENPQYGVKFLNDLFARFDMKDQWSYFDAHMNQWYGQNEITTISFCANADIVINLSGVNPLRDWWTSIPLRMLVDTDPAFTQIKHLTDSDAMGIAKCHTHFATFGENFEKNTCSIPGDGFSWKPTRQPVCINIWDVSKSTPQGNWTTVMQWDSYKKGEYNGKVYGMKSSSFEPFNVLPKYVQGEKFEIALGSPTSPKKELASQGWNITDPIEATRTPKTFQEYIATSKGEWSIAKHGYVITNSGWFSERTLNYMASGKPVVVHDTGFTEFLPVGKGLLPFTNLEEAIEQIKKAGSDYAYHCKESRKLVEEYFDAKDVLTGLLKMI